MQLTPEQQEDVLRAKARSERRVTIRFTPGQKQAWQHAVEQELAAKGENIARFHKLKAAAEQPGFLGDVRRAIAQSRHPSIELSAAIGVDSNMFSDFRAGEAELPFASLDRLVEVLGLRLMQEIPR